MTRNIKIKIILKKEPAPITTKSITQKDKVKSTMMISQTTRSIETEIMTPVKDKMEIIAERISIKKEVHLIINRMATKNNLTGTKTTRTETTIMQRMNQATDITMAMATSKTGPKGMMAKETTTIILTETTIKVVKMAITTIIAMKTMTKKGKMGISIIKNPTITTKMETATKIITTMAIRINIPTTMTISRNGRGKIIKTRK